MLERNFVNKSSFTEQIESSIVLEESPKYALQERLLDFSVMIIKEIRKLPKGKEYEVITYQLIKSSCSVGANYFESQSAVSKADFSNKIGIAMKEMRESYYWIRILMAIQSNSSDWVKILNESKELMLIIGSIYKKTSTSRSN